MDRDGFLRFERDFWDAAGNGDFYREHMADEGLMIFPAPYGIMAKDATVAAVESSSPWSKVELSEVQLVSLGGATAVVYRADAERADGSPYAAFITSLYVQRDGGTWQLAVHQQTPIDDSAASRCRTRRRRRGACRAAPRAARPRPR